MSKRRISLTLGFTLLGMVMGGLGGVFLGALIAYLNNNDTYMIFLGVIGLIVGTIYMGVLGYYRGKQESKVFNKTRLDVDLSIVLMHIKMLNIWHLDTPTCKR